jgi:hypothetical protein
VILPLTSSRLLIGSHEDLNISAHKWREAVARCSLEYFIGGELSEENHILRKHIGEDASPLTKAELEEIVITSMLE